MEKINYRRAGPKDSCPPGADGREIFNYTPQEWQDHQAEILEHVVGGRKQLGLTREWVAKNAGYSITQYTKLL